jgi:hypothetical protein
MNPEKTYKVPQKVLTQEEMNLVNECVYRCLSDCRRQLDSVDRNDPIEYAKVEQKFKQIEALWQKVMKGWAFSLTGMMVQPVEMDVPVSKIPN